MENVSSAIESSVWLAPLQSILPRTAHTAPSGKLAAMKCKQGVQLSVEALSRKTLCDKVFKTARHSFSLFFFPCCFAAVVAVRASMDL